MIEAYLTEVYFDNSHAVPVTVLASGDRLNPFRRISTLSSRTQAGNRSDTQSVRFTLTSSTTATTTPSIPIHRGATLVRSVMVAVLMVKTAAIRIAYRRSRSEVIWRPKTSVSGPGAPAD